LIALVGCEEPFRPGHDLLKRLAGLDVSPSSCRRVSEAAGDDLKEWHRQGGAVTPPPAPPWDFRLRDEAGRPTAATVAYVGLDQFAVPTLAADGRTVAWRMLYAGVVYDPAKRHHWYVADFDREAVAATLRRYACAANVSRAAQVVALTDGGNGLEALLRSGLSDGLVFVLDFWHASQHLHEWAGTRFGRDSPAAHAWAAACVGLLRLEGGVALVQRLRAETLPEGAGEEVREGHRKLVGYFEANQHRTDYPSYRARGWDIGSGPVEAECKVLGGRLKRAGAKWLEAGAEDVAGLRALYQSGDGLWDAFWKQRRQRRAAAGYPRK